MNWAVVRRTGLDTIPVFFACLVGTVGFVILFSWAMVNMGQQVLEFANQIPFIRRMLEMSLGVQTSGEFSIQILFAVCLTHLVVLSLGWGLVIATVTRVTVGEIERGTADLIFTLPLSRTKIFASQSIVWLLAAALIGLAPGLGIWLGAWMFAKPGEVEFLRFVPALANLICVHWWVGSFACLVSVSLNRRAHAVGIVIGVLLLSATLNFVEPFLEPIRPMRFASLLNYFRPVDVVRHGIWPTSQLICLLASSLGCWLIAWRILLRRDLPV